MYLSITLSLSSSVLVNQPVCLGQCKGFCIYQVLQVAFLGLQKFNKTAIKVCLLWPLGGVHMELTQFLQVIKNIKNVSRCRNSMTSPNSKKQLPITWVLLPHSHTSRWLLMTTAHEKEDQMSPSVASLIITSAGVRSFIHLAITSFNSPLKFFKMVIYTDIFTL